ncbi:hypothetical protein FTW_1091 [Francisella tularensis subsp. tularensis WY96-3418]|nr:hypothetical protein FTW_1091 [Francisella tularensis subsp. tularensis WY96-3418]
MKLYLINYLLLMKSKKLLVNFFGANYDESFVAKVRELIERFLVKSKSINVSDIQDIIQDATEMADAVSKDVLDVKSFKVKVELDQKSVAEVTVKVAEQLYFASSSGVGPVDAVLNALCKACPSDISYNLTAIK